jgi:hypothetical protein
MADATAQIVLSVKDLTPEAFARVSKALKQLGRDSKETADSGGASWGKWFATITGGVTAGNLLSDAIQAAGRELLQLPGQLIALGAHGADVADVANNFEILNKTLGNSADVMLGTLRQATGRTISDFDLMRVTNQGLSQGLRITAGDADLLGRASRVLADRIGGDTKTAYETLINAMSTGKDMVLKNIGVNIDAKAATEKYARALGVTADQLNETGQKMAKQQAELTELRRILGESGDAQDDFSDALQRGKASFENLTDQLAVGIAQSPVLTALLSGVGDTLNKALGTKQSGFVQTLVGWIERGAITLADFAQAGITGAGILGRAWSGLQLVFSGVSSVLAEVGLVLGNVILGAAELAAKVPGVGNKFQGLVGVARDLRDNVAGVQQSFHDQAAEALEGVKGNSEFQRTLDAASGVVQTLKDKMVAASREHVQLAEKTNQTTGATQGLSKSLQISAEAMDKAAKARQKVLDEAFYKLNADAHTQTDKLLADQAAAAQKALDQTNKTVLENLDAAARASTEASDLVHKRSLSDYDYQVFLIKQERDAKVAALKPWVVGYDQALAAIDSEMAAKMTDAADTHNQKLAEMKAATNSWGNLTTKWLDSIPGLLQQAFTGGGGFGGAMKGLLSGVGGDIGSKLFGGPEGLGAKLASGLFNKGMGADMAAKFGGVLGTLGGPLGSMVMNFGLGLGKKLFGALFGSAGRDEVKKFADSMGGFDDLHTKLGALGAQGEQLWIKLTQGVGKNNPEQAKKVIGEINDALAHIPPTMAEAAAQAGFQTTASLTQASTDAVKLWEYMRDSGSYTADQVQQAWEKAQEALRNSGDASVSALQKSYDAASGQLKALDGEIASLQKSIDSEAPEAVMGVVEAQARARLAALQKERDAAAKHVEDIQSQLQQSMDRVATALENLPHELDVHVRTHFDGDPGEPMPRHATGAYIRQDHVAQVHSGEIVGPIDFITRAMVGAFQSLGASGTRMPGAAIAVPQPMPTSQTVVMKLREDVLGTAIVRTTQRRMAQGYTPVPSRVVRDTVSYA